MKRGAKWTIGILVLVAVAIVLTIVFINLFKDRETTELATKVNEVAEEGYLAENSDEYLVISDYLSKVMTYFEDGADKKQIQNYKDSYSAFAIAIDFFNKEMLFTEYTDEYKDNLRDIKSSFDDAQKAAEELKDYVNETKNLVGESQFWNTNTWQTSEGYVKTIFEESRSALTKLCIVYEASVTSELMNNDFTDIMFDGFTDLTNQVVADLTENSTKGNALLQFVSTYFSEENEEYILGYAYNDMLQARVKDIKEKGLESALYSGFLAGELEGREAV